MGEEDKYLETVPTQTQGSKMDIVEKRSAKSINESILIYENAVRKLLTINKWGDFAGISAFQLIDADGVRAERLARENDFIRIDIPGPGTLAGMGYDWVRIEKIVTIDDENNQLISMTVRPSAHPVAGNGETAHFLKDVATSTFIVRRIGLDIFAEEHGRNELANTDQGSFFDKGRNFTVGIAAKLGLSYPQWKNLVKGLLKD